MVLVLIYKDVMVNHSVRLALVMPVYGNWADTLECLGALAVQTSKNFCLYLVDDGSPEPSPDAVHNFGFVTYLRRSHAGFAASCNAAVNLATEAGHTHVLLLNNDTSFGPNFVATWLSKIVSMPGAILGPLIFYYDRPDVLWYSGGKQSMAVPFFRLRRRFRRQTAVDILTGCVLLVPVEAWTRLGGFDESYVTYYEDFDFMLRAREDGVPAYIVVEPELEVLHKVSRTALQRGKWHRNYRMITSRLLFIVRWYNGIERIVCLAVMIPHILLEVLSSLPDLPHPRLLSNAIRNGLFVNSTGKMSRSTRLPSGR
jgi:GT2 family glycosyltransferase